MKKFLLTAVMLVGLSALSKAQQGRVGINTTTPAATLDVVANTTDNARPDALLVPRMTRAQLLAKDAAYTAAQNGALAFVTTIDGTATPKTTNVTAVGFYYYDSPSATWKTLGGGAAPATPFRMNLTQAASTAYDWTNSNFDYWEFTSGTQLTLPAPTAYNGRTIYIRNQTGGTLQFAGADGVATPKGMTSLTGIAAIQIYSNGTNWYLVSGRN
ncbi:hypothetical protein ACP3T3_09805 [Chryseobacterium sp. CBSDS_008]|uniref:hypothetical protein n=1 Tax=Chryseobacterium sp. CBSDS_008 TaxID=3415265 RepID=UPI003CEC2A6B